MCGLKRRVIRQIEQTEDHQHNDRHYDQQSAFSPLLIFVLPAPSDIISGGKLDLVCDGTFGFIDETANIAAANVQKHSAAKQSILTLDHRCSLDLANIGNL